MPTELIPAPIDDSVVIHASPPSPLGTLAVPGIDHRKEEAKAETVREQIVAEDANRTWHGLPLKPWSEERQLLLDRLTASDIPLPDATTCDDVSFYNGMFSWAVKALYLALHEPRDWDPLRPRLITHIEAWGLADHIPAGMTEQQLKSFVPERQNVPCGTIAEKAEAVNLVANMVNAHHKVMAMRRVRRMRGGASEGN